jgi:hypothetical protein
MGRNGNAKSTEMMARLSKGARRIGMLATGILTDRLFRGRGAPLSFLSIPVCGVSAFCFWKVPGEDFQCVRPSVMPGQSSVRKGTAGRPAPLYRVAAGSACQAYRAATGSGTSGEDTTIVSPSIFASAQCHW